MRYNATVEDHFLRPRRLAPLAQVTHEGRVQAPMHGDFLVLQLCVADRRIAESRIRVFGCPAAIATSSIFAEMILDRDIDEALSITREEIAKALGGLPEGKLQCSTLGPDALRLALNSPQTP